MNLACPCCEKKLIVRRTYFNLITPHQQQIALMWADSLSITTTAERLGRTEHNISVQLARIRERLGVDSPMELALMLYGLLSGDERGLQHDMRIAACRPSL